MRVGKLIALVAASVLLIAAARAQEKPAEIKIAIATFLSGPASVFGVPGKAAAEMIAEDLNKRGGIGGVPVKLTFIDEGAGGEALVSNYRRVVQDEKVDVTFAAISSGSCTQLVPLAEDLKVMNFMWDCGAASILEAKKYRYNFRTQANATPEMLAVLIYLLKTKPDFKTIAVVNQDYAWGRESWEILSTALKQMKPDVQIVAELFPKFGAPDFSTEVSRLLALHPDVVLTTSWGGDLDTLVRQAGQRGLLQQSAFVLGIGESSLQRLGKDLPEGLIVGARGDHWFLHPEKMGFTRANGTIGFGGSPLSDVPPHRRAALGIGYAPEDRRLFSAFTVEENIVLPARVGRLDTTETRRRLERVYGVLPELAEMRRRPAGSVSGGQGKMVALGRALMVGTRLLILDEPFQGLAPVLAQRYAEALQGLRAQDKDITLLVTESNPKLLAPFCDTTLVIERGEVSARSTAATA